MQTTLELESVLRRLREQASPSERAARAEERALAPGAHEYWTMLGERMGSGGISAVEPSLSGARKRQPGADANAVR